MENFPEQLNLPFYSSGCLCGKGDFSPYITQAEAAQIINPCSASDLDLLTCKHPNKNKLLADIKGLDLAPLKARYPSVKNLPEYIPVIDRMFFGRKLNLLPEIIAISLEDIFTSPVKIYANRARVSKLSIRKNILRAEPLFNGRRVILLMSGRDALLEELSAQFPGDTLFQIISTMGFYAVTSINYSIFFGNCPLSAHYNLKRQLLSFMALENFGVSAIPNIYWENREQFDRIFQWLKENPLVKVVSINCQLYQQSDYARILAGIYKLRTELGVQIFLEGPRRKILPKIADQMKQGLIVASKTASMYAMFGRQYIFNKNNLSQIQVIRDPYDLVAENIDLYGDYVSNLIKPPRYIDPRHIVHVQRFVIPEEKLKKQDPTGKEN